MPPTPSWLWGTWSVIFGMNPPTSVPVVSVMYLPTVPLEFARPFGNWDDLELSSRREVSRALAARTTTLARTRQSGGPGRERSEEHTSELQSQSKIVCRLLLEKKKTSHGTTICPLSTATQRLE